MVEKMTWCKAGMVGKMAGYKDNVVEVYGVQTWEGSWSAWLYMDFDLKP